MTFLARPQLSLLFNEVQSLSFISGLPDSLLRKAASKSREFESKYGKHWKKLEVNLSDQSWVDEMVEFVRKFVDIATNSSCHESPESTVTTSLTKLQHRAQMLLLLS